MKKDVYSSVTGKKKSGSMTGVYYEQLRAQQEEKQLEFDTKLEKADTNIRYLYNLTVAIIFVMAIALITLFYDAIKFHIDYSSNNKDLLEFERRLDRIELQNKLIFKKYPDIFDGLSLQDLQ